MSRINLDAASYWREALDLNGLVAQVYSYGQGELPVIDGADGVAAARWASTDMPNVYSISWALPAPLTPDLHIGVWKEGRLLEPQSSLAGVTGEGQVYLEAVSDTELRLHVYASTDPGALPDGTYEVSQRQVGIRLAYPAEQYVPGSHLDGVWARRASERDATVALGRQSTIRRTLAEAASGTGIVLGSGLVEDATVWGCCATADAARSTLFVAHLADPTGEEAVFRRTRAKGSSLHPVTGYAPRAAGTLLHQKVQYIGATAEYCDSGFGVSAAETVIGGDAGRYSYASGCSEAVTDAVPSPHSLAVDGLVVRGISDGDALFRPNSRAFALSGAASSVVIRNAAVAIEAGNAVWCGDQVHTLVLENCVFYHASSGAQRNLDLSALAVTLRRCIVVGGQEALIALGNGVQYTGEQNVFVPSSSGFSAWHDATQHATLDSWQQATGQDLNSIVVEASELPALFAGDVAMGDFRLGFTGAGMTAREMGAGLTHEIAFWPALTATVEQEAARLSAPPAPRPSVQLLNPHRITAASPRLTYKPADLDGPFATRLQWLVAEILSCYPDATTDLDVARCLRDWIARTAIHPYYYFHLQIPAGTGNETLAPGLEREDLLALDRDSNRQDADSQHWAAYNHNGYRMLCDLLGLDVYTGAYTGTGQMSRVSAGHWQMNDFDSYHFALCSYQQSMLQVLMAAAGLHAMLISTVGHDPGATWIPSLGKWIYNDPTYNEVYTLDGVGDPLSPTELMAVTAAGELGRLTISKTLTSGGRLAPTWATGEYITSANPACTYLTDYHPAGYVIMGSLLSNANRWSETGPGGSILLCMIDVPARLNYYPFNNETTYPPCKPYEAFPHLGCAIVGITPDPAGEVSVELATGQPHAASFEQRIDGGSWTTCAAVHTVSSGSGPIQYRSLDGGGRPSSVASLSV